MKNELQKLIEKYKENRKILSPTIAYYTVIKDLQEIVDAEDGYMIDKEKCAFWGCDNKRMKGKAQCRTHYYE